MVKAKQDADTLYGVGVNSMNEFRVFGPPGTGKTSWIMNNIKAARKKYDAEDIFVTSFTKAAAQEIVSRDRGTLLPERAIGTLHAHCYRALGTVELAEKHVDEFSKDYPEYALTTAYDLDDPYQLETKPQGMNDYQEMTKLRSMMIPMEQWPVHIQMLSDTWTEWKYENGLMDFTDLLETALRDIDRAPNDPSVGFVDEAQDLTPLQFAIVRKWAEHMDSIVIVGDRPVSVVFHWCVTESMLFPMLPQENIRTLTNTYRLPKAILDWSQNITQVEQRHHKDVVANRGR